MNAATLTHLANALRGDPRCSSWLRTPTGLPTGPSGLTTATSHTYSLTSPRQSCGDQPRDSPVGIERDETAARSRALGITAPLMDEFACILPGHSDTARLRWSNTGRFWQYVCPAGVQHGLAEIRAFVSYGEVRQLKKVEIVRWRERLDYEAGLRMPRLVDVDLPDHCSDTTRKVAEGIRLLLALRSDTRPGESWDGKPFVFAREFAMAWCSLTSDQAREGVRALKRAGVIELVSEQSRPGKPVWWRPSDSAWTFEPPVTTSPVADDEKWAQATARYVHSDYDEKRAA